MHNSRFHLSAIASILLASTSPAAAATITYTVTGNGTAIIGGVVKSGAFTFVGVGNNAPDTNPSPTTTSFLMTSVSMNFAGTTGTATNPMYFFTNNVQGLSGFDQVRPVNNVGGVMYFVAPIFSTYDPATALGPIPVDFRGFLATFDTTAGLMVWQGNPANMTFTASLPAVSGGVPEPATWGLMITGFGIAGAALRRKPKVAVSFG